MILAIDKPHGITSFDVIRKLKPLYPKKTKIGHSGTLDPFATGLMLIGVEKDTKRLTELTGLDKTYIATIDFSQDSDTWDLQYWDWIKKIDIEKEISVEDIEKKLDELIPKKELPLTPFSAKKKDGKKLYELARKGEAINEFREMKTNNYKIIKYEFPILEIELDVGSGTYIRSIAHRLGKQFELGGILTGLRRTKIGDYDLKEYTFSKIPDTEILFCEIA